MAQFNISDPFLIYFDSIRKSNIKSKPFSTMNFFLDNGQFHVVFQPKGQAKGSLANETSNFVPKSTREMMLENFTFN